MKLSDTKLKLTAEVITFVKIKADEVSDGTKQLQSKNFKVLTLFTEQYLYRRHLFIDYYWFLIMSP